MRPISISLATAVARAVDAVTTPTVAWAVEQGIALKDKVCIYGGSYGGPFMSGLAYPVASSAAAA